MSSKSKKNKNQFSQKEMNAAKKTAERAADEVEAVRNSLLEYHSQVSRMVDNLLNVFRNGLMPIAEVASLHEPVDRVIRGQVRKSCPSCKVLAPCSTYKLAEGLATKMEGEIGTVVKEFATSSNDG